MPEVTKEVVLEKLRTVRGPDMEGNIVDLGLVSDVFISDGKAYFSITVPADRASRARRIRTRRSRRRRAGVRPRRPIDARRRPRRR